MIVAGFGFRKDASLSSLRAALIAAQRGVPPITHLATVQDKVSGLAPLAEALRLPLIAVGTEALASAPTHTRSGASLRGRGTGSVAEAAALVVAGPGARLLRARHISPDRMATCAIAEGTIA